MKCDFCGKEIEKGSGKIIFKDNGKQIDLCSNKCEKNMIKFKKKPRNLNWTEISHKEKQQRLDAQKKHEESEKKESKKAKKESDKK
jgi:large subunit ribosomal protein L24e